jgi:hypothetical protein
MMALSELPNSVSVELAREMKAKNCQPPSKRQMVQANMSI